MSTLRKQFTGRIELFSIIIMSTFLLCNSCQTQDKGILRSDRIDIFEQVWSTVNEHFYDPAFNGVDWQDKYIEYKTKIETCKSAKTLLSLLNKMLFELNSSHCGVGLITEFDKSVSPYIFSNGEIGIDIRIINTQIVITKVLENSSADLANIKAGFIIEKIDGLTISEIETLVRYKPPFNDRNRKFHLTAEVLRHIYGQSGTKIEIIFLDEDNRSHTEILTRTERINGISLGFGLPPAYLKAQSYLTSDSIAYLSFNAFNPADMKHVLYELKKVNNSKGLIIDLRGNDGGSIEGMKLLLGRFVSERIKYGTYINRNERNEDFIEPIGNMYFGKVVLLVDEMSISGAENMAGIVQLLQIGRIIGNRTPGQMLWGNGYLINDSIALAIPIYKFEYPNGYNPENNGIIPDIEIQINRNDLLKGRDSQIQKAIEYINSLR